MSVSPTTRAQISAMMLEHGPLCPADLDPDVWAAVAANYDSPTGWEPGPEYHAEYRDARIAAFVMREKMQSEVDEARELAKLALSLLREMSAGLDELDERLSDENLPEWAGGER